jgi:hypothetical protein
MAIIENQKYKSIKVANLIYRDTPTLNFNDIPKKIYFIAYYEISVIDQGDIWLKINRNLQNGLIDIFVDYFGTTFKLNGNLEQMTQNSGYPYLKVARISFKRLKKTELDDVQKTELITWLGRQGSRYNEIYLKVE